MGAGELEGRILSRREFLRALGLVAAALAFPGGRVLASSNSSGEAITMNTRPIPASGESLPVVGLGTWQQFDVAPEPRLLQPLKEVLRVLYETGGSVVDTSPMYNRAEPVLGTLLKELGTREKTFLATKVWTSGRQSGIRQMRESMRAMNVSTVDLMQVHNLVDWETHLRTLREWKQRGTIRYLGITHYTGSAFVDLESIMKSRDLDFVQLPYSIGFTRAEKRLLPLAADRGIAVLVNRPFEAGGLFRSVRGEKLPDWAPEIGCETWAQFFLKFILGHPAVTCVIPGTSNPQHMLDNARAGTGPMPDENQRSEMLDYWESL